MAYAVPYCSLATIKAALTSYQSSQDKVLTELINMASLAIDRYCKRPIGYFGGGLSKTKTFDVPTKPVRPTDRLNVPSFNIGIPEQYATELFFYPDGLLSLTSLKTDPNQDGTFPDTWVQGLGHDFLLYPQNAVADGHPYTSVLQLSTAQFTFPAGPSTVQIVGTWGEATVIPDDIQFACQTQVLRWFKRPDAPFGVLGPKGQRAQGEIDVGIYFRMIDPDVQFILERAGLVDRWMVA